MGSIHTARDTYEFTAGDIAAALVSGVIGRTYHHQLKGFRSINAADNVADSPWESPPTVRLRSLQIIILRPYPPTLLLRGVLISAWSILVPEHPDISTVLLHEDVQGEHNLFRWHGNYPMGSGFEWRVYSDALAAGDIANVLAIYE
jgi:hypothetical protein